MLSSQSHLPSAALETEFPLFPHEDFDFVIAEGRWPVGLSSRYPQEYSRRVAAGAVSYQMMLKSIDYTLRKYLKDAEYPTESSSRLDNKIADSINRIFETAKALFPDVVKWDEEIIGTIMSDVTIVRLPSGVGDLLTLANRGLLFESSAVARSLIEQMGWAIACRGLEDAAAVKALSATRSINALKQICPNVGSFYGWLSGYVHWAYDAHKTVLNMREDSFSTTLASSVYKARSLLLSIIVADCYLRVFRSVYQAGIVLDNSANPSVKLHELASEVLDVLGNDEISSELHVILTTGQ